MAYDFPNLPADGQVFTPPAGPTWVWSHGAWVKVVEVDPALIGAQVFNSYAQAAASVIDDDLQTIHVAGYYEPGDGGGSPYKKVIIEPTHAGKLQSADGAWWEITAEVISVRMLGAVGDGVANDTAAITNALALNKPVYVPDGIYRIVPHSPAPLHGITARKSAGVDSVHMFGESMHGTVIWGVGVFSTWGTMLIEGSSGSAADNVKNVHIHDLTFRGNVDVDGHVYASHLLSLVGVGDVVIERVHFKGFHGDGLYLGGREVGFANERHNERVAVRNCLFDGLVKDNRNGLSIIDCDEISIVDCTFTRIGAPGTSQSVGPIDMEPNDTFAICRDMYIGRNKFIDCDTVNTGGVTYFNSRQTSAGNIGRMIIEDNYFDGCYRAFTSSAASKDVNGTEDVIVFRNNRCRNTVQEDFYGGGLKNVIIEGNTFFLDPIHPTDSSHRGGISAGGPGGTNPLGMNAIDWKIVNNSFIGLKPQYGCVAIFGARGLKVTGNSFTDIQGRSIALQAGGSGRRLESITVDDNFCVSPSDDFDSVTILNNGLISEATAPTTEFISYTNVLGRRNVVRDRVQLVRGGSIGVWHGQQPTAFPANGTWRAGSAAVDGSRVSVNIAGQGLAEIECVTGGSYGTLTGVTGNINTVVVVDEVPTNKLRHVTGIVDPSMALREGHYVTVSGMATVVQISRLLVTNIGTVVAPVYTIEAWLSADWTGTFPGTALAIQLAPPVWSLVNQPKAWQTTAIAFTLTPFVSPFETFHTGTLSSADQAVTLSTTNAVEGWRFRVVRTGTGAFLLDVNAPGPTLLKALATNTWCEVSYDGAAWKLSAYGAL